MTQERYDKLPKQKWDGKCMLYSSAIDVYFADMDAVVEWPDVESGKLTIKDMRLQLTEPVVARPLDLDYFAEEFPYEDYDMAPDWLTEAIAEFNEKIDGNTLSWSPIDVALEVS